MSYVNFRTVLFNQTERQGDQPELTGHVEIPVDRLEEFIACVRNLPVVADRKGNPLLKLRLGMWYADEKSAPQAAAGEMSFRGTAANQAQAPAQQPAEITA